MTHELIITESVLLLPQSNSFSFSAKVAPLVTWNFKIEIINNTTKTPLTHEIIINNNNITIQLNRWYSETWVENSNPFYIVSKDEVIELDVKVRLYMNAHQHNKHLIVSIWKREN